MNIKNICGKLYKTNKFNKLALFAFVCGGMLLLSGCAGTNRQLEKEHIMNNGCFITCRNNIKIEHKHRTSYIASFTRNKITATKKINLYSNPANYANHDRLYG
ncbi:MAG: hypothetical protein EVJ46_04630 [Candidatus Acididesulfobacter guangdongensis]|uniref:Uncharacterized protein n=1 Tax=Acididesulfobacter guangdongensis TaxID=2597225 RepID=A0A519BGD4_ACIG2|nr:MAG: hypothetical protein EVJ46_04630 [Candidatus Acididesulfobacter guangdongensis]